MRKLVAFLCLSLLLLCFLPLHFDQIEVKAPNGFPVHNLDTGFNYTSIQAAITANETLDGHTIFVEQGTYYEQVVVNKSISLVGENRSTTIIDGNYTGNVINLTADHIRITGFTIQNGAPVYPTLGSGILVTESIGNNISYNIITNSAMGVWLLNSSHNVVSSNTISNNTGGIFLYSNSNNNTVVDNVVSSNNSTGIGLNLSNNNKISGNSASNGGGIGLSHSNNNTISGNTAHNNTFGISFYASSGNNFLNNNMTGNTCNFGASGYFDFHFNNSVDTSNIVDGRPIYYLIGETGTVLDASTNAGTVYLINCNNITIKDLILTKNARGITLYNTLNSTIKNVTVINNFHGILLYRSSNNTIYGSMVSSSHSIGIELSTVAIGNIISGNIVSSNEEYGIVSGLACMHNSISKNNISYNYDGIYLWHSLHNSILGNNITANSRYGIWLWHSSDNTLSEDKIENNGYGISLGESSNNFIYHNNFINNLNQTVTDGSENSWDNGFEGNYWSNYNGTDTNSDGIGDVPYEIDSNNNDTYPLMGTFHSFNTSLAKHVNVICNSTVEDFEYFDLNSTIKMNVSNMTGNQTCGFCRVAIPHDLMNVSNISVVIDNGSKPVLYHNFTLYDNGTHRWIYFEYEHSTLEIVIIPEFPSLIILPLFMIATLLAVIVVRRKRKLCNRYKV